MRTIVLMNILMLFCNFTEAGVKTITVINGNSFGDLKKSCRFSSVTEFDGEIVWKEPNALHDNPKPVQHITIIDDRIVLYYSGEVVLRSKKTGAFLWKDRMGNNFSHDVSREGYIRSVSSTGYLGGVTVNKETRSEVRIPFADSRTYLHFLNEYDAELRYCYSLMNQPVSMPGAKGIPPTFSFVRYDTAGKEFIWEYIKKDRLIDVLCDEKANVLVALARTGVYRIPLNGSQDGDVSSIHFKSVYQGVMEDDGTVHALVEIEENVNREIVNRQSLISLCAADLKIVHQVPVAFKATSRTPLAIYKNMVYLVSDSLLYCFDYEKEIWRCELPLTNEAVLMSVVNDGTVLVATGPFLLWISSDGIESKRMVFTENITCRPVVDEAGLIYMAGAKNIYCIK